MTAVRIFVRREPFFGDRFDFLLGGRTSDGRRLRAQRLIDELWNAGLRPAGGIGSVGQLAATERHLADMRALVFETPPPQGVQPRQAPPQPPSDTPPR